MGATPGTIHIAIPYTLSLPAVINPVSRFERVCGLRV